MKKLVISSIAVLGLCLTAGCAVPVDAQDDSDTRVGDAQEALSAHLPCAVNFVSFTPWVTITNNTSFWITQGTGSYIVSHGGGVTAKYEHALSNVSIPPGGHVSYNAGADPNDLYALSCTSFLTFINDP